MGRKIKINGTCLEFLVKGGSDKYSLFIHGGIVADANLPSFD